MASVCRPAVIATARPLSFALGGLESASPLHNAIASARLISNLAVDASCWSWLSQGRSMNNGKWRKSTWIPLRRKVSNNDGARDVKF
ncbi:hypothetical protein HPP92_016755 [Vanilla planifolia]|uniref:Uncharacterized protein n=1 Tax=Vanilla planifolia TaxID=51239 RepID=A0A835UQS6_VANPL|nr:hypothetical protein HPP92_016755 [Vanilla planifolia]